MSISTRGLPPSVRRDKTVVITSGGNHDPLCSALVRRFATDGADVVVVGSRPREWTAHTENFTSSGQHVRHVLADLDDIIDIARALDSIGEVDILVNNADNFGFADESNHSSADWYAKTFRALAFTCAVLPSMRSLDAHVVNLNSVRFDESSEAGAPVDHEAALARLTKTWAVKWHAQDIRVNSVALDQTVEPAADLVHTVDMVHSLAASEFGLTSGSTSSVTAKSAD